VQVRLIDDGGRTLDATDGQTMGEIDVRGPNVFLEYLNLPDATAGAFHEGWFAMGDVATRSADGYLHIVGRRATDLIESGGYKIGAGEIEDVLREHPAVEDAAVTGEPDDDLGERIVAWVVRRPGKQVSGDELVSYVARMLDPHKRPRVVRFVDELPHDALGKVQKNRLPR
jgi:malonyl-CoA/methylmalonyl-CoA synthetase